MDARETRIRILNLQDNHCRNNCEYHSGKTHPYCTETCKIGQEIQQLGSSLITDEKTRESKTRMKWNKVCLDVLELKKEDLTYAQIAEILGYEKSTIRKQLKNRGLLQLKE